MNVVFSSHLFGSISYFQELLKHQNAVIDFGEHFVKQSPRNRFDIGGPNGRQRLTVNTKGLKGAKTSTGKVEIAADFVPVHLVRSLNTAYHKSPFYEFYKDELIEILLPSRKSLRELNILALKFCCETLEVDLPSFSEHYIENPIHDFRNATFKNGELPEYEQTFSVKHGHIENLSILDLIFHLGPSSAEYLKG